ncbi:MAG: XdhC/CoxI family protein [Candidatus Cloacimonetes bacterium]|nr:XdhC/CoxI family protein [Candidatus Cloacimonadota bacterium]
MKNNFNEIIMQAAENLQNNKIFVMATVLESIGGTPCRSGFKMIVFPDGSTKGTVGGGLIEKKVIAHCIKLFDTQKNEFLEFELTEAESGIGMQCGGNARLFLEFFPPARTIYLFGAGHLCQSIVPILKSLSFHIVVIDNRAEYADSQRLPQADSVICRDYIRYTAEFTPAPQDAIIIFTHAHTNDYSILFSICQRQLSYTYIGMIASHQKAAQNLQKLLEQGIKPQTVENIHTPIGLNIAKTTTQEIAISITAELLATYNNITTIHPLSKNL